jgi:hypothetical protein
MTDWTYDADHACRIRPAEMASRAVGVLWDHLLQRAHLAELFQDLIGAKVMLEVPLSIVVKTHELYKANVIRAMEAQSREIHKFVIVDPPHYHHIYFYWIEPDLLGSLDGAPDSIKLITTGDAKKFLPLESVQTNIDAADAGSVKVWAEFFQEHSVGSEAKTLETGYSGQTATEVNNSLTDERFSTRKPDLGYTHVDRYLNEAEEFLV